MKVVLLPQAQEALDAISDPLLSKVIRRLQALKEFPELGAPMTGPFFGYRSLVVGAYRVVYKLRLPRTIEVAYLRDCRRVPLA